MLREGLRTGTASGAAADDTPSPSLLMTLGAAEWHNGRCDRDQVWPGTDRSDAAGAFCVRAVCVCVHNLHAQLKCGTCRHNLCAMWGRRLHRLGRWSGSITSTVSARMGLHR